MIASVVLDLIETHRVAAQLTIAAGMSYGLITLVIAVVRTASDRSRHAAFWSPPRPGQLLAAGQHSEAGRRRAEKQHRREYAATRARHTARTVTQPQPVLTPAALQDTVPIGVIVTLPDMYARTA